MISPDRLNQIVGEKVAALQAKLLAKVEANLSGDVLQTRTGALKQSILATLDVAEGQFNVTVESRGVPYAAIQEQGGTTASHEILPVKARALAFAGAGGQVFARRVAHPGSRLPPRPYLSTALESLRSELSDGLKSTIRSALGAD